MVDKAMKARALEALEGLSCGEELTLIFVKPKSNTAENKVCKLVRVESGFYGSIGRGAPLVWSSYELSGMIAINSEWSTQVVAIHNGEVIE